MARGALRQPGAARGPVSGGCRGCPRRPAGGPAAGTRRCTPAGLDERTWAHRESGADRRARAPAAASSAASAAIGRRPGDRHPAPTSCHGAPAGHRPRRRPGRRHPRRGRRRRAPARGRRAGPRPAGAPPRRAHPDLGPAPGPGRAHPPARGPRRRAGAPDATLPRRSHRRIGTGSGDGPGVAALAPGRGGAWASAGSRLSQGDAFRLGAARVDVLWPPRDVVAGHGRRPRTARSTTPPSSLP